MKQTPCPSCKQPTFVVFIKGVKVRAVLLSNVDDNSHDCYWFREHSCDPRGMLK